MSFDNITILYIKGNSFRINFRYMSKDDAINWMVLFYLIKEVSYKFSIIIYILGENNNLTYYQKNRDVILNRAKHYYENNKKD